MGHFLRECPSLMRGAIASFSTKRVPDNPLPGTPTIGVSRHPTSEFIQMSCCSRKMIVASKDTRNYTSLGQSPAYSLKERSNACFSVECSEVLTMGYACKKSGGGRRVERDCPNEVLRVHPLRSVIWLPLYIVQGQATYKELGSPDRAVVSLREGKLAILVVIMVLCPCHGTGWHGATVLVVVALLAR
jgi:hypothetical protein